MIETAKKLPIGIQTFSEIIEDNYYYVDKTAYIEQLLDTGKYLFLSRPRRFGKSLLLDTIAELFSANQSLFKGLYIEDKWDWHTPYPIIRLSFADGILQSYSELQNRLKTLLQWNAEQHHIDIQITDDISGSFRKLIIACEKKNQKNVVVLVDEYDKPILDNLTKREVAAQMRDSLRDLYSVIKAQDAHIKFAMLTGVSKFSKVSIFSGLNNLNDISMDEGFSAICGYTQHDLDTVFAREIEGFNSDKIKQWYNGYNWCGEAVYNPFDILLLLQKRLFKPYWFETGTPTFLIDVLIDKQFNLPQLQQLQTDLSLLSSFEIDNIAPEALLFQTGYLTIGKVELFNDISFYTLTYPNLEVQQSLNTHLLEVWTNDQTTPKRIKLTNLLTENDFEGLKKLFTSFYNSIPYDWYRNNSIAQYEGYYASVFYAYFASLGMDIRLEDISNAGRIDMTVNFNGCYYLFEFKVVEENDDTDNIALKQLKSKDYAQKYLTDGQPIFLIGVVFDKRQRKVIGFDVESVNKDNLE